MCVAALDLCKELFSLSGWKGAGCYQLIEKTNPYTGKVLGSHRVPYGVSLGYINDQNRGECVITPLYDVGYVMRMLPHHYLQKLGNETYIAKWTDYAPTQVQRELGTNHISGHSNTSPENALCRLAIALFEAGVLVHSDEHAPTLS